MFTRQFLLSVSSILFLLLLLSTLCSITVATAHTEEDRICPNDDTFGEVDITSVNSQNWNGVSLRIKCNSNQITHAPFSIQWHFKAVPDDHNLQMWTSPAGFLKPSITSDSLLGFEFVPPTRTGGKTDSLFVTEDMKEAGVEVLIPQSKFMSLDVDRDFDSVLVNLTYSELETFQATITSGSNRLWIDSTGDTTTGNTGPQIHLNNTGVANDIRIISPSQSGTQITSDGSAEMELLGTLSRAAFTGSVDTLLVEGDVTGSVTAAGGLNQLIINPASDNTDPCASMSDTGFENSCQVSNGTFFNISSFETFECKSSGEDELLPGACAFGVFKFGWTNNDPFDYSLAFDIFHTFDSFFVVKGMVVLSLFLFFM